MKSEVLIYDIIGWFLFFPAYMALIASDHESCYYVLMEDY